MSCSSTLDLLHSFYMPFSFSDDTYIYIPVKKVEVCPKEHDHINIQDKQDGCLVGPPPSIY